MKTQYKWKFCAVLAIFALAACSKSEEYKDYLANGEIIYPARADSVAAYPGNERVLLSWITTDPRITYFNVFWNGGADSVRVPPVHSGNQNVPDTTRVTIANLSEGTYEFSILSYDEDRNVSIPSLAQAAVYGEVYRSTLLDRAVNNVEMIAGSGFAAITWYEAEAQVAGVEVSYTNEEEKTRQVFVPADSSLTRLSAYKAGTEIRYTTLFLPHPGAIDTFRTDPVTIPAPALIYPELDKSGFSAVHLPGDVGSAWGWEMPFLWDGSIAEGSGFHTPEVLLPQHFTFELGRPAVLHEMQTWQRQGNDMIYNQANIKKFEVWGSNDPAMDGSFTGWVKLAEFESVKPSGLPLGTVSQEDIDQAAAGETFAFPEGTPAVRYIRIKILENWSGSPSNHLMEVTFRGEY